MTHNDKLVEAAKRADWMQVVLNQGPPCFQLLTVEDESPRFCLAAERWRGHHGSSRHHHFVSLADMLLAEL